jgi:hypothetical protein
MKPIDSTAEILAFKMLGHSINKKWVTWAYDMISAGFETESLLILAGEQEPFNQFEMQRLTNKVLDELNLAYDNRELVLKNYVRFLIDEALSGKVKTLNVLSVLKNICIELDFDLAVYDFYLLYHAKNDLIDSVDQYYWDGATRENIDEVIRGYFVKWIIDKR